MVFRLKIWVLAVFVSAALTALWCSLIFPAPAFPHAFVAELSSPTETWAQIYYQRGAGWRESESAKQMVQSSDHFVTVRLPLPPGKFRAIRFDPMGGAGSIRLRNLRVETFDGRVVRRFSRGDFTPNDQIDRYEEVRGVIELTTPPDVNDPQLAIEFDPIMRLALGFWSNASFHVPRWGRTMALFLAVFVMIASLRRYRARAVAWIQIRRRNHPASALAVGAAIAAIVSSYPVVFFGKSFVSPNTGAVMLYDRTPSVPGDYDTTPASAYGADVGALHWQHLPYSVITGHALFAHGEVPLWNRHNSSGTTLLGQGQSMLGDPLHLLVVAAGSKAWAFDIKYVLCKAIFAFGVGFCVWLLTRDFAAAMIMVGASAFVAFFNYRANHPAIFSLSYSPWVLVGWLKLIGDRDGRALVKALGLWFLANWMLLTSGTVKEAYLLCAALNLAGASMFFIMPIAGGSKLKRTVIIGVAGLAFIAATAPVWWTLFDALQTAKTSYDVPMAFQHRRAWLIGLFDDMFLRELAEQRWVVTPAANLLVLFGCLAALVRPGYLIKHRAAFAILLNLLFSVSVAYAWIPADWITAVPFLRNVHHVNNHFSCIAVVLASVLAGCGLAESRRWLLTSQRRRIVAIMASAWVALLGVYFNNDPVWWTGGRGLSGWLEKFSSHAFFYVQIVLLTLAIVVLAVLAARRLQGKSLTIAGGVAGALALIVLLARHGQHLASSYLPAEFCRTAGARAELLNSTRVTAFLQEAIRTEPRRIIGTNGNLFPGFMSVHGLEGINGPDAIFNPRYRELLDAAEMVPRHDWRVSLPPQELAAWRPMLDFLNVGFVASSPEQPIDDSQHQEIAALDLDVHRSPTVWPRAFFTSSVETYREPGELVSKIRRHTPGQPFAVVQEGNAGFVHNLDAASREQSIVPAVDYRLTPNSTEFTVRSDQPGIAVLHETWLPHDFQAELDGEPVPYFRVNHAFKGVVIPAAGTHRVRFTYWPRHLTAALWFCCAGFVSFGVLCAFVTKRRLPVSGTQTIANEAGAIT